MTGSLKGTAAASYSQFSSFHFQHPFQGRPGFHSDFFRHHDPGFQSLQGTLHQFQGGLFHIGAQQIAAGHVELLMGTSPFQLGQHPAFRGDDEFVFRTLFRIVDDAHGAAHIIRQGPDFRPAFRVRKLERD